MYKLLVVDDEYNIRDGIVNAIPWHKCNVEVVGDAGSGAEALEKVEQFHPDIVITDIYMDDMDGLELAENLKQKYPSIKIIILSGYDEFEYAKKALELKVFSYLLKPVLPEELMKVVSDVINELQNEERLKKKIITLESEVKINKQMLQEKVLNDLVQGKMRHDGEFSEKLRLAGIKSDKSAYVCLILSMDGYHDLLETQGMEKVYKMLQCIQEIAISIFEKSFDNWSYIDNMRNIIVVLGGTPSGKSKAFSDLHPAIEKIRHFVKNAMGITITVAVGGIYGSISEIAESYTEALKALDMRVCAGKDCVIYIDDVYSISGDRFSYPKDREDAILAAINESDDEKVRSGVKDFSEFLKLKNYSKEYVKVAFMELFAVIMRKFTDSGVDIYKLYKRSFLDPYKALDKFDTIDEIGNWLTNIVLGCQNELRKIRNLSVKSVINKARNYIEANYTRPDISLNSIAEHVYLTPSYFSKLYKKETGETYMEYLTSLRINRAKALLKETNIRISDVGAAVGYLNSQYFTTLFKKVTGKTPVEYREGK